jgi:hypothetical protein
VTETPATSMTASSSKPGRRFNIVSSRQFSTVFQSPEPPIQLTVANRRRDSRTSNLRGESFRLRVARSRLLIKFLLPRRSEDLNRVKNMVHRHWKVRLR